MISRIKILFFSKKWCFFDALVATEAHLVQGWESHILKLVHRALKYVIPSLVQGGLGYRPKARLNAHSPLRVSK